MVSEEVRELRVRVRGLPAELVGDVVIEIWLDTLGGGCRLGGAQLDVSGTTLLQVRDVTHFDHNTKIFVRFVHASTNDPVWYCWLEPNGWLTNNGWLDPGVCDSARRTPMEILVEFVDRTAIIMATSCTRDFDTALAQAMDDKEPEEFLDEVVHTLEALAERTSPSRELFGQAALLARDLTSLRDLGALRPILVAFISGLDEAQQVRIRELLPW